MVYLTAQDLVFLSPLLILISGALLILLIASFFRKQNNQLSFIMTLITFSLAICAANYMGTTDSHLLTPWLKSDQLTKIFTNLFLIIGIVSALLAHTFFEKFKMVPDEYYFLLLASVFGLILIGAAADFLTLFLGLETLSLALYVLCGYVKKWIISHESALKYFLLGSLGTAFLLYGIALIYGATGTTQFELLMPRYASLGQTNEKACFLFGISFVAIGLLFKATIVPFHNWVPDVYEGATTPLTAFMAVGTKIGAFAALSRIFLEALPEFNPIFNQSLSWVFYPTLILANFVAIRQINVRRFFAYSGISHSGYLLIPLAASQQNSLSSILFYVCIYAIATFGAFAVFAFLDKEKRGLLIDDLKGLFFKCPLLATILTLSLLTLAGIPLTAGFFAKFYIFKVGFHAGYYALVIFGLLMTILSAYYYLRIMAKMMQHPASDGVPESYHLLPKNGYASLFVGLLSLAAMIVFALFPDLLLHFLQ